MVAGYVAAVFFPLAGLILGYTLTFSKKTLPDGSQVPIHSAGEQRQGKRIWILANSVLALWSWQLTGARIFS